MVAKIKSTNDKEEKKGKVEVGKLLRDRDAVTNLTESEQRQIQGGAPQTKPVSARVPRPGDGGCDDEFGCTGNHNETLVRDV